MFLLFFQSNVAIDFDEFTKLVGRHLFITLLRRAISALDTVHRDAVRPQHALYLSQHLIFLFETDVAKHVEAYDVIKTRVGERQARKLGSEGRVVPITARC